MPWHDCFSNVFMKRLLLTAILFVISIQLTGQEKKRLEIIHADEVVLDPEISDAQRLLGNVQFKFREAFMYCDSAYRHPNGDFDAYSNVRINQGDTLRLFSDFLHIDKEGRVAELRESIRLKDKQMTLTTESMNYDFDEEIASYFGGGTIISSENNNRLSSEQGFYDPSSKFFQFRNNVVLKNPEYTVESDTLRYSSEASRAFFYGPTNIYFRDSEIYCENGWYDSDQDVCQFNENAVIRSGATFMKGDSIFYSGASGRGEVFRNVEIRDTTSNYLILGQYGWHNEKEGTSLVTEQAEMIQIFESDSLFLHADTLTSREDSLRRQQIFAYHKVKFFKNDLQGKADSLTYFQGDSLLSMFGEPIIWSKENQIIGDQINMTMSNGKISEMHVTKNSMIISQANETEFNQIKGKETRGFFKNNALEVVFVYGNGQIIYFPTEVDETGQKKTIGMNNVACSDVRLDIKDNDIVRVSLLNRPSGVLHPLSKTESDEQVLEGFYWNTEDRPEKRSDIFIWPEPQAILEEGSD